jgi:hypothetical protein
LNIQASVTFNFTARRQALNSNEVIPEHCTYKAGTRHLSL